MCAEVDPVSGVVCLDTSGVVHRRHYGLGFDGRGSWSASWLDRSEIVRLLAGSGSGISREEFDRAVARDDDYSPAGLDRDAEVTDL